MAQSWLDTRERKIVGNNHYELNDALVLNTIQDLREALEKHCGPKSNFSILSDPFNPLDEVIFTTDGYNIMRSISFNDPVAKMIHKLVLYIGERISTLVGDGTTTGMLIALNLMEDFMTSKEMRDFIKSKSYSEMNNINSIFFKAFEEELKSIVQTPERLRADISFDKDVNLIKSIAYFQARTSSHGDEEIAEVISEMFVRIPKETLDNIIFMRAGYEMPWRIKLIVDEHQYSCQSTILSSGMLNHENKSKFLAKNCVVKVLNGHLTYESPFYATVYQDIVDAYENNTNYVFIGTGTCGVTNTNLHKLLADLNGKYENKPAVGIFWVQTIDAFANDAFIISLVAGIPFPFSSSINTLPKELTVTFDKGTLAFDGFYEEKSSIHEFLRPMYKNLSYPQYNAMCRQLEENIKNCKDAENESVNLSEQVRTYTRLKNLLLLDRRCYVMIGGTSHDNNALTHIVEDCVHAVRKSLTQGFVPGSLIASSVVLKTMVEENEGKYSKDIKELAKWYLANITKITNIFLPEECTKETMNGYWSYDIISNTKTNFIDKDLWEDPYGKKAIIQPANTDIIVFQRIQEVLLKFFFANDFINTGG